MISLSTIKRTQMELDRVCKQAKSASFLPNRTKRKQEPSNALCPIEEILAYLAIHAHSNLSTLT